MNRSNSVSKKGVCALQHVLVGPVAGEDTPIDDFSQRRIDFRPIYMLATVKMPQK